MTVIDYAREPHSDIAFIDMKSFYASVECVDRGLNPLTTCLCVMSRADNANGLILASSPIFKKIFGKANVSRSYDLPFHIQTRKFNLAAAKRQGLPINRNFIRYVENWAQKTLIVPPRMDRYIEKNMEIQKIFQRFAAPTDILPYSIDEAFIDLTSSLNYFISHHQLTKKEKLDVLSSKIQQEIWRKTGIISTVGMSNANPLLAKLALDNEAKKTKTMRANWSYEDVETKVWNIPSLTDFWGIGSRTEKRLHKLGIHSIKELAESNPDDLQKEFGIIGVQLWFHANGVDESNIHQPYKVQSKGIGNSQILPRDYIHQEDVEVVLSEMAEQVAIRLRRRHKKTKLISIYIGFSKYEMKSSLHCQEAIEPSNQTAILTKAVLQLFRKKYHSGAVRQIGVRYSDLVDDKYSIISLFDDPSLMEKEEKLQQAIDGIRDEFGFLSIQKGTSLLESSRNIARSKLIGGHSAGGLEGLK